MHDHPIVAMGNRGFNLEGGTFNRLVASVVEEDQTRLELETNWYLTESKCKLSTFFFFLTHFILFTFLGYHKFGVEHCVLNDTYLDKRFQVYGFPAWSRQNCENFLIMQALESCSALLTQGNQIELPLKFDFSVFKSEDEKMSKMKLCKPKDLHDLINGMLSENNATLQRFVYLANLKKGILRNILFKKEAFELHCISDFCYSRCREVRYEISQSSTKLHKREDVIYVKLFFSSLTKKVIETRPQSKGEIICKF